MKKYFATSIQILVLLLLFVFVTSAVSQMQKSNITKDVMKGDLTFQKIQNIQRLHKVGDYKIPLQILNEDWVNNDWVIASKIINTFNGNLYVQMRSEMYDNGVLEMVARSTITYNANDLMIEWKTEIDTNASGTFVNSTRETYTYSNNQMESSIVEHWDNNAWVKFLKSNYTYQNGLLVIDISQTWDNGAWVNSSRLTNTYENGNIVNMLTELWQNGAWTNSSQIVDTYDNNGNKIESKMQSWDGSSWKDTSVETWTYDGSGKLIESTSEMEIFPGFSIKSRQTYIYGTDGKLSEQISDEWDFITSTWKKMQQILYTYKDGDIYQELIKEWDGFSQYVNDGRITYTYSPSTDVADLENNNFIPTEFSLSNYPNPFNPETTIQFSLPKETKVWLSVYDVKGNLINSLVNGTNISMGSHSIIWNGFDRFNHPVPSGVYVYRLHSSQVTLTGKCTLIR